MPLSYWCINSPFLVISLVVFVNPTNIVRHMAHIAVKLRQYLSVKGF